MKRILVLNQQRSDLPPHGRRNEALDQAGVFRVAFHQLGRNPGNGEGRSNIILHQFRDSEINVAVVRRDIGPTGTVIHRPHGQGDDLVDQFADPHVFGGNHGNDRDPKGFPQDVRVDPDPLVLGHIDHVHGHDNGGAEQQQFRKEIEASFRRRGIDQKDNHVGAGFDDEVPGDAFLFRQGRQAVRAGKVDDPHFHALGDVGALFFFHRLSRPVAHMLRQSGEDVENRRLSHIGLTGQGHGYFSFFRRRRLLILRGVDPVDQDLFRLAASERHPGVSGLHDGQAAADAQHPDGRMDGNAHGGQPADQRLPSGHGVNQTGLAFMERGQGNRLAGWGRTFFFKV